MRSVSFSILLGIIFWKCGEIVTSKLPLTTEDTRPNEVETAKPVRKWISEILVEVKDNFRLQENVSKQCRDDFIEYDNFLRNQTVWAVRMMESSEWPGQGLFAGATTVLGGWKECLSVRSPTYRGQYCLVDATYDYSFVSAEPLLRGWDRPPNQNSSVWAIIKTYDNIIRRSSRRNLTWALCVPSSCTAEDLRVSVMNAAVPVFGKYDMNFVANVESRSCRTEEEKSFSYGFLFTFGFLLFLGAFVLAVTYYDYRDHKLVKAESKEIFSEDSLGKKVLYTFSALESWKCLTYANASTIFPLYFAKGLMSFFIISAHDALLSIPFPKIEQEGTEMLYQPWQVGFSLHLCVDIFFGISGFITFHFGYERTKKDGILYFIKMIVCRWIRLIPVMALFILVYVFITPELLDGPLWNRRMQYDIQCCRSNWWTNILSVQNIVNRRDICLPQTWFIAADFQLTIVGGAILLILANNFKLGIISMVFTFLVGIFGHFYVVYTNKFSGLPSPAVYEVEVFRKLPFFSDLYIQMYSRIGPYMVGSAGALLLRKLKDKKCYPSAITCISLVAILTFIGFGTQMYGFLFTMFDRAYDPVENAIYGAVTRTLFTLPAICIVVLFELRRMGWLSDLLELKISLVSGRLAYVLFLSSFTIQVVRFASKRLPIIGTDVVDVTYETMIDICLSLIGAALLFGLAEGPLHNLTVLLLPYVYGKNEKEQKAVEEKYSTKTS